MDDMRIGVDARPLTGPPAGIKTYLSELLNTVAGLDGRHEFILYAHRPITFDVPSSQFQVRIRRMLMDVGTLWLQLYAPALAAADGVDLFWGADFLLPLGLPQRIPAAVTVYDLVPFLFPQTMQLSNYLVTRFLLPPSLARAQRIMVISESAAADVRRVLGISPDRISVVTPGVRAGFAVRDPLDARHRIAARLDVDAGRPYLLTVGTVEPRKNLITLVRALASLPRATRTRVSLLVARAPRCEQAAHRLLHVLAGLAGQLDRDAPRDQRVDLRPPSVGTGCVHAGPGHRAARPAPRSGRVHQPSRRDAVCPRDPAVGGAVSRRPWASVEDAVDAGGAAAPDPAGWGGCAPQPGGRRPGSRAGRPGVGDPRRDSAAVSA